MHHPHYNKAKTTGFTLVELSIVLVIIGLIVGGIVGGQSLIKSAENQGIIKDVAKYKVALNAFRLQYDATPGDMSDATAYWGTDTLNGNGS